MHCDRQTKSPVAGANKMKFLFLAAASAAVLSLQTASAVPLNNGFETGDFTGWTVTIPTGVSQYIGPTPAGSAGVYSSWGPYTGMATALTAHDGNYFAAIGSDDYGFFTAPQSYDINARMTFSLHAGDVVSGWAAFYNGDYEAQDMAHVGIFDSGNNQLSTPWLWVSGGDTYRTLTPWQAWQWQAPTDGNFTIELGVTTFGDNTFASYGLFDSVGVSSVVPVPEPTELAMVAMGLCCLVAFNRRPR